jgi:hypothetical protein
MLICEGAHCNGSVGSLDSMITRKQHHAPRMDGLALTDTSLVGWLRQLVHTPHYQLFMGDTTMWACTICGHHRRWGGNPPTPEGLGRVFEGPLEPEVQ